MCLCHIADQLGTTLDQIVDLSLQVEDNEILRSRFRGDDLVHQFGLSLQ